MQFEALLGGEKRALGQILEAASQDVQQSKSELICFFLALTLENYQLNIKIPKTNC